MTQSNADQNRSRGYATEVAWWARMLGHQSSLLKYVVIFKRSLVSTIDREKIKVKWLGSEKTTNRINVRTTTRITLLGDAIHAMNPLLGLGTNNAMRDAWKSCIQEYENEMIKRISKDVLRS